MAEYDMPIEEQVKSISKELRALSEAVREGFAAVNEGFAAVDKRFAAVDKRFDVVDKRIDSVDKMMDKLQVLGEETNAIARLGREGLQGMRESMDAKFAKADKKRDEQIDLLKSATVHVRKRVEVVERPKTRRRR